MKTKIKIYLITCHNNTKNTTQMEETNTKTNFDVAHSVSMDFIIFLFLFFKTIRRLSKNDVKLTEDICDAMNKIFTKGEVMEKMIVELRTIKKKVIKWQYVLTTDRIIYYSSIIHYYLVGVFILIYFF